MKPDRETPRGFVEIDTEECKGCGLCVEVCPVHVLRQDNRLNRGGYLPAAYLGEGCTGCGICFYVCPEPGGITVYRRLESDARTTGSLLMRPGATGSPPTGRTPVRSSG